MKEFKYITKLSTDEIESNVIIPCLDAIGSHTVLIKNSLNKSVTSTLKTDNLNFQIDAKLNLYNRDYFFHIISCNKNDNYSINQFQIIFDFIFKKIDSPISGSEMLALVTSLEDFFRTTPDKDLFSLQVGVFGELLTIKYLYDLGYVKIIDKYHQNFYSKHDIELDKQNRIEIKTTISEKRIHSFKHNQIFREDIDVYVCSIMLEQSKEGLALFDLFNDIISKYESADSIFALQKLMKRCGVSKDNVGLKFAIEKAFNDIKFFDAKSLPKIELPAPKGVSNIVYDVDCSLAEALDISDFIKKIEHL